MRSPFLRRQRGRHTAASTVLGRTMSGEGCAPGIIRRVLSMRRAGIRSAVLLLSTILLVSGCGDDIVAPVSTVAGLVINSATGDPVAGAMVSIGGAAATAGPDGRFELTGLSPGPSLVRCSAPGFEDFSIYIAVPAGAMSRDIALTPVDLSRPLRISAIVSDEHQMVFVYRGDRDVDNAVVALNGLVLTAGGWDPTSTSYEGRFGLTAGLPIVVEVEAGGLTVQATGNVPEAPVLTAPAEGKIFSLTDSITITWTSAMDPDGFDVLYGFDSFCCASLTAPGTARELKIAASDIGLTVDDGIAVFAFNEGSFTGPAAPGSHMSIRNWGDTLSKITVIP